MIGITLFVFAAFFFINPVTGEASDELQLGDQLLIEGKDHEHVTELQKLLSEKGLLSDDDVSEGEYDTATREAVLEFQEDTAIYTDGVAGPQTVGALSVLEIGDEGETVLTLQESLHSLGFYNGNLDGIFGPVTRDAVKEFQQSEDILVDGLAGPQTYGALHQAVKNSATTTTNQSSSNNSSNQTSRSSSSRTSSDNSNSSDETNQSSNSEGTVMTVEATAYTAYCNGCSGTTATGIDLRNNPDKKVIAVDPNVIPLGTMVEVEGYGVAIAGDTGGAIKGNKIDIFMPDRSAAVNFGRRTVEIRLLE